MVFRILSATKNSFIFLAESELNQADFPVGLQAQTRSIMAKELCRSMGSGADGLVIVRPGNTSFDFIWDFYNRDGSSAEMCGNAARCMAYYVKEYCDFQRQELIFQTIAGPVKVRYQPNNLFSVRMPDHQIIQEWMNLPLGKISQIEFCGINTGVPHAVVEVPKLDRNLLSPIIKVLRFHPIFGSGGANVSFYSMADDSMKGITFERGVEDFTASCGTGVTAMAIASALKDPSKWSSREPILIKTPGGALQVNLEESKSFSWLTGPAVLEEIIDFY